MIEIKFIYKGRNIPIQCNKNDLLKDIFNKFEIKIENNSVYYLYKGNKIDKDIQLEELIKGDDINNINILVNNINEIDKKNIVKSKLVKCPECKENIRIKMNDYKIKLYDCKNGHNIENLLLEEYENTQKIDISEIKCNICNINNKRIHLIMNFMYVIHAKKIYVHYVNQFMIRIIILLIMNRRNIYVKYIMNIM